MESLRVRILSEEYAFRTENPDLTRLAAEQVNRLIGEYRQKISDYSPVRLAVLAATSLAEKAIEHERRLQAIERELARLNRYVETSIESSRAESGWRDEPPTLSDAEKDIERASQRSSSEPSKEA
ncbi:MAG: cell division protein ZapA [Chloroherpetonaceae bacterium]|nr:cell division protein ZapA [Chloroherpetonaceae bacterium]MDW8438298.1 cell division protein ZapA [Chloroherpetonaceae bacterium]